MTEAEYYKKLGEKFKALRKKTGRTTAEVADKIGVNRALLAQFENNGKKLSAYRIDQLLDVFGLSSIQDLVDNSQKKTQYHPRWRQLKRYVKRRKEGVFVETEGNRQGALQPGVA